MLGEPWNPADPKYGEPGKSGDPDCPGQNASDNCLVSGRLVRLEEDPTNPNHAKEEEGRPAEKELLQGWCQQFSSHSIGELRFGPEGALYVSGGDGAAFESIPDYGQLAILAEPLRRSAHGERGPGRRRPRKTPTRRAERCDRKT